MAALQCPAEFLLFGGAAGSLKSTTMLVAAAQQIDNPRYKAIIFRKSFPEIEFLMDRSIELYTNMGFSLQDFNQSKKIWRASSGAKVEFKFIAKDKDIYKYQGPEYQFMGFDESTQFPQEHVRYLVNSRGRSTDPSIKQQVFMATNPGNVGHSWHKHMFIGPRCIHCLKSPINGMRVPGKVYQDAKWLDGVPVGLTTCFIPGKVTDHDLYGKAGEAYAKKLKGLTKSMMKALLEGCWEAFEGMYFDVFSQERHVVPHETIRRLYDRYWGSWVGTDYGFAHAGVSYLCHRSPTGRIYIADEYVAHRQKASEYAATTQNLWGQYKPQVWYLSPDTFECDGDEDFSRAQQMSERTGLVYTPAYNDRIGGWTLCYSLLDDTCPMDGLPANLTPEQLQDYQAPKMLISDRCELLIKAIPTRIHDDGATDGGKSKHRLEDVKKTTEDEDDAVDGWRYSVASHVDIRQKSLTERIQEKMTAKDPTSAMIQRLIVEKEFEKASRPVHYDRRSRTKSGLN